MQEEKGAKEHAQAENAAAGQWRRWANTFWMLALLALVIYTANSHFYGIAEHPYFDVHSDDVLYIERFMLKPAPAAIDRDMPVARAAERPERGGEPRELRLYWHGIEHPALERWVFHYLLAWTGRMPESLPEEPWDYSQGHQWNIDRGHVAPAETRWFVRVTNAAFMVAAAALLYVAVARAVTPFAGFLCAMAFVDPVNLLGHTVEIVWSLGPDPLLWLMMAATLVSWVYLKDGWPGAMVTGAAAGLAASSKLNGAFLAVAFCGWLLYRHKWRRAIAAGAVAFAVFVILNPILWSRGVMGIPRVVWDFVAWGRLRAPAYAASFAELAGKGWLGARAVILGRPLWLWAILIVALLASRRLRKLEAVPLWAAVIALGHLLTVPAPAPRYIFPVQAGLLIGVVASYWPRHPLEFLKSVPQLLRRAPAGAARPQRPPVPRQ